MNPEVASLIAAAKSAPNTHVVLTLYADGEVKRHEARSLAAAENWAIGERRKLNKDLIDRASGKTLRVVDVTVAAI